MRCIKCKHYIPDGAGFEKCPECGFPIGAKLTIEQKKIIIEEKNKATNLQSQLTLKKTKEARLTRDEKLKLEKRIEKGRNRLIFVCFIMIVLTIAVFLIPIGFLPSKKGFLINDSDRNLTFVQSIGFIKTVIILLILGCLFFVAVLHHTKYFKLKKDLIIGITLTFDTKIIRIRELAGDAEKEYDVYLEQNIANINKLNYLISEFPNIQVGDMIKVTMTKNAHFVVYTGKLSTRNR